MVTGGNVAWLPLGYHDNPRDTVIRRAQLARQPRRLKFTARSIGHLAGGSSAVDWFDEETPGLALRVTPGGARTWYLFYKKGRTTRRVKLGGWPGLELAKARRLARRERVRIETEGADPAHERRESRDVFTVCALAELFVELHSRAHKRTWRDDQWRLDAYVIPAWRTRPVGEIGRQDVHELLDKIAAAGKPIQANRVQSLISKMWNFAIDRELAEHNPCHRMAKRGGEHARERVLTDDELRALCAALDARAGEPAADALKLRLLTGQRGGEVHKMMWADVDVDAAVWTIPGELAKNGRAHRVPLSEPALTLLKARDRSDDGRVFPGLYHQRQDLLELLALRRGSYTWHDLRRTVSTRLAELGFAEETIGRVLNHAKRGVTATVYNQHAYDTEKRKALDAWAEELGRF